MAGLTYKQRRAIKEALDRDKRKRLNYKTPRDDGAEMARCPATLGPFSSRPGQPCGAKAVKGKTYCGIHREFEEDDAVADLDTAA